MSVIVEIKSGAGGEHSKKLVYDQFAMYCKLATRECV